MRSTNPSLMANPFSKIHAAAGQQTMTVRGVVYKTVLSLLCVLLTAGWTWMRFYQSGGNPDAVYPFMMGGVFGGLILAIATIFKMEWAPVTTPLYALAEGFFIGGISSVMESTYPGIVAQAVSLTFGTLFAMLAAYQSGLIRATEKFKLGVVAATGGIALVYFITIILGFFGIQVPFVFSGGLFGIGFSLFVVVIAALNFILDFDMIEKGASYGAPKYMEWYGSFALMVTLIWLYIEFLRLLSKIRSR